MLEFETSFYLSDNGDRLVDERGPIEISSTSLSKELFLKLLLRNLELNFRGKFCEEILDEFINILYDILVLEFCESIIPSSSFFFFFLRDTEEYRLKGFQGAVKSSDSRKRNI